MPRSRAAAAASPSSATGTPQGACNFESCHPSRLLQPAVKIPRKTIRYECVGGPRDGDVVLIQRSKQHVTLDGATYHVRLWAKMDEHGQRLLWKREALVWEGLLHTEQNPERNTEPSPPQPVDCPAPEG